MPVRSIAPASPPVLEALPRPAEPPGLPEGCSLRPEPFPEPSRPPGAGTGAASPGRGEAAAQHMVYMLHYCIQGLTFSPGIHLT